MNVVRRVTIALVTTAALGLGVFGTAPAAHAAKDTSWPYRTVVDTTP
jgi:hypothetical protein